MSDGDYSTIELGASLRVVEDVYRAMISAFIHAELAEYESIHDSSAPDPPLDSDPVAGPFRRV